jgi:hypothetical protein
MFFIKVIFTAEGAEREYGGLQGLIFMLSGLCVLRGKDNRLNDYHIPPVNANGPNPVRGEFDEIPGA